MNMKKRSQSSLRAKTIQSQQDINQQNYWIGNMQTKNRSKLYANIASSMIQQSNKQNSQSNFPIYQSVQQLSNRSQILHRTPTTNKTPKLPISNLPPSYTTPTQNQNQFRLSNQQNGGLYGPYNYVEQYYEVQIQTLNNKISQMSTQLKKYRDLYSSKQSQLSDLNQGMSERITKQNCQKNVLIKQINCNNIEIKRLKQEVQLYKSQKQTLKIILNQKQTVIGELNKSIAQIEINKKKVQGYQTQLRQSQSAVEQIQLQLHRVKSQMEKKDTIIAASNKKISSLQTKLIQYQQEIKLLQKSTIALKQDTSDYNSKIDSAQKQCQQWKNKYCQVKLQLQQIPQLEIKLKNTEQTINQLQVRMKDLIVINQKLKMQVNGFQSIKNKMNEMQKQISQLKKIIRNKNQQLQLYQNNSKLSKNLEQQLQYFRTKSQKSQQQSQQKDKQLRQIKLKIQQKQHKIKNLSLQLQTISKQSIRIKQLQSKVDTLYTQNQKLHSSLFEKIGEIQELQRKINLLESKNNMIVNQCTKIKAMYENIKEQLSQSQSKVQNMKNRWQAELGAKIVLQQKCTRFSRQIVNLKAQILTMQQTNNNLTQKTQQIIAQFELNKQQFYSQLDLLTSYKEQAENHLQTSYQKIDQFRIQIKDMKSQINIHITKQQNYIMKIRQLETKIINIQQQLIFSRNQTDKLKKMFIQIQQISGCALTYCK